MKKQKRRELDLETISKFCGLTIKDLDMEKRIINIDHQLQRDFKMEYHVHSTKTNAGTRKIPMTQEVYEMFQTILEDREPPAREIMVDGYAGFLFTDKKCMPLVAMHWEHRFNSMVHRYNEIYRVQIPNITPHVCRHTLLKHGKIRNKSKSIAIFDGSLRHQRNVEYIYACKS